MYLTAKEIKTIKLFLKSTNEYHLNFDLNFNFLFNLNYILK